MKTQERPMRDLASLGFSLPTLARLTSEGIHTIDDLVVREEKKTSEIVADAAKQNGRSVHCKGLLISSLPLSNHTLNCLLDREITTIPILLTKTAAYLRGIRSFGYRGLAEVLIALIERGYSEDNSMLLSQNSVLNYFVYADFYKTLLKLDSEKRLPVRFKRWFNEVLKGRELNRANRPNRKILIKPFNIGKERKR